MHKLTTRTRAPGCIGFPTEVVIESITSPLTPPARFQNGRNVKMEKSFIDRILSARDWPKPELVRLQFRPLEDRATERAIETALPAGHLMLPAVTVGWILADLLLEQRFHLGTHLLRKYHSALIFTQSDVVRVVYNDQTCRFTLRARESSIKKGSQQKVWRRGTLLVLPSYGGRT